MKPSKEQIQRYYSEALARCLEAFSLLDEKEWNKKASNEWTAKEYLSHLAATHEQETMVLTRQALAGQPPHVPGFETREDALSFREKAMQSLRHLPASELLERMKTGFETHLQMLNGLSEADLDKPAMSPAWDRPGTVRDLFFASYLFLPSQYQEIRRAAKKKLPHWVDASTPEQVHYHMDRLFNYMPLIFRSDRGQDMQATYLFTMEGDGGGQWAIQIAGGKAESLDGTPSSFDMELKTKPNLWIDLSTGELNPVFAIAMRKVQLGGNAGLAMKLESLFQVS